MEKRNWDPKSGSGWMKDPKDGLWYKYKNFERTGKSQKTVVHRNPLVAVAYEVQKLKKWNKEQVAERLKINKKRREEGWYKDGRGNWKKGKKVLKEEVKEEVKEENNEENNNKNLKIEESIFAEQPLGTNLGIGNYLDLINLDIDYTLPENQLKVDKGPKVPTNNMPSSKYARTKKGDYYSYRGKMYQKGSVSARKADNIMEAKLRAQEMARRRLQIQQGN